jgi:hypothetical protein
MKKATQLLVTLAIATGFMACNSNSSQEGGHKGHDHGSATAPKNYEDSLYKEVIDGHDVGMAKIAKIKGYASRVQQAIDSVKKLPAAAQQQALAYKQSLDSLLEDLQYADMSMDTWMTEFVPDSAQEKKEVRIKYLEAERLKVNKVKENILSSLEKAAKLFNER